MAKKTWLFQNIANMITILGLILSFWFLTIVLTTPNHIWVATILAGLIGLSDVLDGKIARRLDIKTFIGGALDRLRDKIFICPAMVILLIRYKNEMFDSFFVFTLIAAMVTIIVLLEIALLGSWLFSVIKRIDVSANRYGKRKMVLEFTAVMVWLIFIGAKKTWGLASLRPFYCLIIPLLFAAIYFAVKSLENHYQGYSQDTKKNAPMR